MLKSIQKIYGNVVDFLKGVRAELKRVTWPSSPELRKGTIAVLVILIIVTTFLWVCETLLVSLLGRFIPM